MLLSIIESIFRESIHNISMYAKLKEVRDWTEVPKKLVYFEKNSKVMFDKFKNYTDAFI